MNIYNIENTGCVVAYILDINGDKELWGDVGFAYQLSRPTPDEVAEFAHKLTCTRAYRGKKSIHTAHRRLFSLAKRVCPDLLEEAIEKTRLFNEDS
jgi:hypothetical protein